jgi:hypothetical protein
MAAQQQPPGAQAGAGAPLAPIFSRFLGEYINPNAPDFIDWSNERELKTYKSAITGLEEKFDLSPIKLQSYLSRVQERVTMYNWTNTILQRSDTKTTEGHTFILQYSILRGFAVGNHHGGRRFKERRSPNTSAKH